MNKELANFLNFLRTEFNVQIQWSDSFIIENYNKKLADSAQGENSNVSDNVELQEIGCHKCLYKNNGYSCSTCSTAFSNFVPIE